MWAKTAMKAGFFMLLLAVFLAAAAAQPVAESEAGRSRMVGFTIASAVSASLGAAMCVMGCRRVGFERRQQLLHEAFTHD